MDEPRLYDIIYSVVRQVPAGRVATYGQNSRGDALPRMVGFALAALANLHDDLDVPWQRVINAKGMVHPSRFWHGNRYPAYPA